MSKQSEKLLEQLNIQNKDRSSLRQIILCLSLLVVLIVFWSLKLTGIGVAGDAFCGREEHEHTADCVNCTKQEHIHVASCYSDIFADLEDGDDWKYLKDIAKGPTTKENLVLIAQSQLGYAESTLNFQVEENGARHGITRYGQWYGNPYGNWSAMFTLFCIDYAGEIEVPMNAGPEALRVEWEKAGLYKSADARSPRNRKHRLSS